jgi:hypothetical protein
VLNEKIKQQNQMISADSFNWNWTAEREFFDKMSVSSIISSTHPTSLG